MSSDSLAGASNVTVTAAVAAASSWLSSTQLFVCLSMAVGALLAQHISAVVHAVVSTVASLLTCTVVYGDQCDTRKPVSKFITQYALTNRKRLTRYAFDPLNNDYPVQPQSGYWLRASNRRLLWGLLPDLAYVTPLLVFPPPGTKTSSSSSSWNSTVEVTFLLNVDVVARQRAFRDRCIAALPPPPAVEECRIAVTQLRSNNHTLTRLVDLRPRGSLFLDADVERELFGDVRRFFEPNSSKLYARLGAREHYCALLVGPPGTAKTSAVVELAGQLEAELLLPQSLRIFIENAEQNNGAFDVNTYRKKTIVFFEDIDRQLDAEEKQERNKALVASAAVTTKSTCVDASSDGSAGVDDGSGSGGAGSLLSRLLNAIDGVFSRSGTVVLASVNRVESLPAALVRPGRIDKIVRFPYMTAPMMRTMLNYHLAVHESQDADVVRLTDELLRKVESGNPHDRALRPTTWVISGASAVTTLLREWNADRTAAVTDADRIRILRALLAFEGEGERLAVRGLVHV